MKTGFAKTENLIRGGRQEAEGDRGTFVSLKPKGSRALGWGGGGENPQKALFVSLGCLLEAPAAISLLTLSPGCLTSGLTSVLGAPSETGYQVLRDGPAS